MLSRITIVLFIVISIFSVNAFSEETKDTPDWLKRVELSAQWETDKQPTFYFQTVQPLSQTPDKFDTFFYQPRISLKGERTSYNLGFGYRKIVSEDLLVGTNIFGDYQDLHQHGRVGIGFEALWEIIEARFNSYFGISGKREIGDTSTSSSYEKAVDGLDYELGSRIPCLPWLKIYGSGFWYDFEKASDKEGWKIRMEAKPSDAITLEFYSWDDNKGEQEYGGRIRFYLPFDRLVDFKEAFRISDKAFPKKDLRDEVLLPVERNFDIVVESWSEDKNGSVTVSIGRTN